MKEKNLETVLSSKEKELPYISHNLSPLPFEQPSLKVTFLLEYFFNSSDTLQMCNDFFPVDLFGKDFPLSFTISTLNSENFRSPKKLIVEFYRFSSYDSKTNSELARRLELLIDKIHLLKRLKGSFMYRALTEDELTFLKCD